MLDWSPASGSIWLQLPEGTEVISHLYSESHVGPLGSSLERAFSSSSSPLSLLSSHFWSSLISKQWSLLWDSSLSPKSQPCSETLPCSQSPRPLDETLTESQDYQNHPTALLLLLVFLRTRLGFFGTKCVKAGIQLKKQFNLSELLFLHLQSADTRNTFIVGLLGR